MWLSVRLSNSKLYAVKIVPDSKCRRKTFCGTREEFVSDEVVLWESLSHPNIVKLEEVFLEDGHWILVMEFRDGYRDLFSMTARGTVFSEKDAANIIRQVIEVCSYLISEEVDHRDLKDENILYHPVTKQIKLIDFGSASFLEEDRYTGMQGTEVYIPPEFFNHGSYHPMAGMVWSIGCLAYVLVTGSCPFNSKTEVMEHKEVKWADYKVGPLYRDFVDRCLERVELLRCDLFKLQFHPLIRRAAETSNRG